MRRLCLSVLALLCLGLGTAAENHAYHGLWGGLFRQQPADGAATATDGAASSLHAALADLQSRLLARLAGGADSAASGGSSSASSSTASMLEGLLGVEQLEGTLGGVNASLARLHDLLHPSDAPSHLTAVEAKELAAAAALHGWVLGAAAGSAAAAAGDLALHAATGTQPTTSLNSLGMGGQAVDSPSWEAFKPHTCTRLQNFGNAEGYHAALLGGAPCATLAARAPAGGAVTGDALRWGTAASFFLECSRGGDDGGDGGGGEPGGLDGGGGGVLGGMLQAGAAAATKAAAGVAAALDVRRTCRLALTSGGAGSGASAHLEHSFERPLLGAPKINALRLRLCNLPPSSMQFPAALARGPTVTLSGLRLNGRPLLPDALAVPQAAAAEGCAVRLLRLSSKVTGARAGFVLSGWLGLGGEAGGEAGDAGGGFGVGEMASLELQLGSYHLLDAATTRLFPGAAAGAAAAAAQQVQRP